MTSFLIFLSWESKKWKHGIVMSLKIIYTAIFFHKNMLNLNDEKNNEYSVLNYLGSLQSGGDKKWNTQKSLKWKLNCIQIFAFMLLDYSNLHRKL